MQQIWKEEKCEYCEEPMPFGKMYVAILERNEDWSKNLTIQGHKYCTMAMHNHYKRTGKLITKQEVLTEQFDPMI